MATTVSLAQMLGVCETNGAGRLSWWYLQVEVDNADTEITNSVLITASVGAGQGFIIAANDANAPSSGQGILRLDGAATGLSLALDTGGQTIEFRNNVNGAQGVATDPITTGAGNAPLNLVVQIRS